MSTAAGSLDFAPADSQATDAAPHAVTHLGLGKDTPAGRPVETRPSPTAKIVSLPRCGGLHHRYVWSEAA